jgi:hypothetical protein
VRWGARGIWKTMSAAENHSWNHSLQPHFHAFNAGGPSLSSLPKASPAYAQRCTTILLMPRVLFSPNTPEGIGGGQCRWDRLSRPNASTSTPAPQSEVDDERRTIRGQHNCDFSIVSDVIARFVKSFRTVRSWARCGLPWAAFVASPAQPSLSARLLVATRGHVLTTIEWLCIQLGCHQRREEQDPWRALHLELCTELDKSQPKKARSQTRL